MYAYIYIASRESPLASKGVMYVVDMLSESRFWKSCETRTFKALSYMMTDKVFRHLLGTICVSSVDGGGGSDSMYLGIWLELVLRYWNWYWYCWINTWGLEWLSVIYLPLLPRLEATPGGRELYRVFETGDLRTIEVYRGKANREGKILKAQISTLTEKKIVLVTR